jgi:multiple sugar transport system permease protein
MFSNNKPILKRQKAITRRNRICAYAFLLPNFIGFVVFTFLPVIFVLVLSVTDWNGSKSMTFVGLKNFIRLFGDSDFKISFLNTVIYTFGSVPVIIVLSMGLAIVLNKGIKGAKLFRAFHFFPYISSIVAVAVVWQFMYNADLGPINQFLKAIGIINPPKWISSSQWALPAVMIMTIWRSVGYYMIIFLAGLQTVPSSLYEAAIIDGANNWKKFWHITIPLLHPTTFFVSIMCIINSFRVFTQIYIMTQGGPGRATSVLVYRIYVETFENYRFGYAAAISLVLFICVFIVTLIQYRFQKKLVDYL